MTITDMFMALIDDLIFLNIYFPSTFNFGVFKIEDYSTNSKMRSPRKS